MYDNTEEVWDENPQSVSLHTLTLDTSTVVMTAKGVNSCRMWRAI